MKAIITVGISGSGKTTWAEDRAPAPYYHERDSSSDRVPDHSWVNINRDDIRRQLFNFGPWSEYKFSGNKEARVTDVADQLIFDAIVEKKDIIVSDTNLNPKIRNKLINKLTKAGYEVEIKEFPCMYEEAIKRNAGRKWGVEPTILYQQYQQWLVYIGRKRYATDYTLPKAILVDVDGTVASKGDRSPFDWNKVDLDSPREVIIDLVVGLARNQDAKIIVLSGRDSVCRDKTEKWLKENWLFPDLLYMRAQGDQRKDAIIKEELFWEHVADNYNVVAAVDDRPCMIRLWYELGIPNVISVANPWVEF